MINFLKKYWFLILIIIIAINFSGFYLIKNSPDFLDLIEHAESDEMIRDFERSKFKYEMSFIFILLLDISVILYVPYLIIRNIKLNVNKK
ncbi:hypothetical protein SAMN05216324_102373 [Chryseobacterium limigenitum]|uniref:Uncharacterized protein n=1 Tax=Chryseobacterium limigenitum TaxID=1612149 RepID=A0A1K2IGB3_9FLAO|nr:hypothetical protein SAMN05216324_102373 [Chryseobacterium limigenitum]